MSKIKPKYPIFIPSKGRWQSRLTVRALDEMGVSYHVVVEPGEYDQYASVIDKRRLLVLPWNDRGLPAARQWIYDRATDGGKKRHWQLDDNISAFYRLLRNHFTKIRSGAAFRIVEDFTDRYLNVAVSGMQYRMFIPSGEAREPFTVNHRVYSAMLFLNGLPYKYLHKNEDTDWSIQVLKDGWCTIYLNAVVANKIATMQMKGGMTSDYLFHDGRRAMAEALERAHPDVVTVGVRWGRPQHKVDYRPFAKNKLIRNPRVKIPKGVNNYGLTRRRRPHAESSNA